MCELFSLTIRSSLNTHFLSLRKSKITHRFWAFAQFIRAMCPALGFPPFSFTMYSNFTTEIVRGCVCLKKQKSRGKAVEVTRIARKKLLRILSGFRPRIRPLYKLYCKQPFNASTGCTVSVRPRKYVQYYSRKTYLAAVGRMWCGQKHSSIFLELLWKSSLYLVSSTERRITTRSPWIE